MADKRIFSSGKVRKSSNDAAESVVRKVALIVELLRQRRIRFSAYTKEYARNYRSFQRDLQQLRKIGVHAGFEISKIKDAELVELVALDGKTRNLNRDAERVERLTATIARSLGEPIVRELGSQPPSKLLPDDFFVISNPKLVEGTAVADICATLRSAHSSPSGRAAVRFRYPARPGQPGKEREVEPYRIALRSGAFYLIGYDRGSKGWRTFALDRFLSKPVKAGTCGMTRDLPDQYASNDVIGFMKGSDKSIDVTVELAANVAQSATARGWQAGQRIEKFADGRARMTFVVSDIGEVIRWALGFGADAKIVAPPEAVDQARTTVNRIAEAYGKPATAKAP
jgi:predicted DNA-binding transcriptional regulator YafY